MFPGLADAGVVPALGLLVLDELDVGALPDELGELVDAVDLNPGVTIDFSALLKLDALSRTPGAHDGSRGLLKQVDLPLPRVQHGHLVRPAVDVSRRGAFVDAVDDAHGRLTVGGAELLAVGGPDVVVADVVGSGKPLHLAEVGLERSQLRLQKTELFLAAVADVQNEGSVQNG